MPDRIELKNKLGTGPGAQVEFFVDGKYGGWLSFTIQGGNPRWIFGQGQTDDLQFNDSILALARRFYRTG
ncbi:MAG: hypothetical protein V1846_01985 [Candidatus Komeilibacteria bacterium]